MPRSSAKMRTMLGLSAAQTSTGMRMTRIAAKKKSHVKTPASLISTMRSAEGYTWIVLCSVHCNAVMP